MRIIPILLNMTALLASATAADTPPWSEESSGIKALLCAEPARIQPSSFLELTVKFKNVSEKPIAVQLFNPFAVDVAVQTPQGTEVKPDLMRADVLFSPSWENLSAGGETGYMVGEPKGDARGAQLDTTLGIWNLKPGKYRIVASIDSGKFSESSARPKPENVWKGKIKFAPIDVEVLAKDELELESLLPETTFKAGDVIHPKLRFSNVSENEIRFTYFRPVLWEPTIIDSKTKERVLLQSVPYNGPAQPVEVVLAAGKTAEVEVPGIHIGKEEPSGLQVWWNARPGKYELQYIIRLTAAGANSNSFRGTLVSKTVKLDIKE